MPVSGLLTVEDFSLSFPQSPPVVDGLSFTVAAGEAVGLVGPSGSGKSLTALSLLGLLPAAARINRGRCTFQRKDGSKVDLLRISEAEHVRVRGTEIGYVFQEPQSALNPVLSCGRQLEEAVRRLQPAETAVGAAVDRALDTVGLSGMRQRVMHALPRELSGGQLQRVMIAMSLAGRPKLLVADEPTTALDTLAETEIVRLLERLRQEYGMGLLFISHDEQLLRRVTSRQVAIRQREQADQSTAGGDAGAGKLRTPAVRERPVVEVRELSVTYAGSRVAAVQSCSFTVREGEWVGLIGPSGCGKSSIAGWLVGLVPARAGKVIAPAGTLPATAAGADIRKLAGGQLIFQDVFGSLNPVLTVGQALREIAQRNGGGDVDDLLRSVGLPPSQFAGKLPHELSGGQRQRVAIARALAARPRLLICDEALSGLDVPLRREIVRVMARVCRDRGVGVLFITHNLRLALDCTDTVLLMEGGKIVERGLPEDILQRPRSALGQRLAVTVT